MDALLLQLEILSNGGSLHEVAHIANGSHPRNCISLLRINVSISFLLLIVGAYYSYSSCVNNKEFYKYRSYVANSCRKSIIRSFVANSCCKSIITLVWLLYGTYQFIVLNVLRKL